ncbi:MAG: heme o synthase [Acidobacteria bacterium]|nr:heme o synthase [Acidobacteriota bacterium]
MNVPAGILSGVSSRSWSRWIDLFSLGKPRIVLFVLLSALTGFLLGGSKPVDAVRLLQALLGTALAAAGSMALNQYMEREADSLMERTRRRPIPDGRLSPRSALWFGIGILTAGVGYLATAVNLPSALFAAATAVWYLLIYTPLKRKTPFCFLIGGVCGATPPLIGWSAATGNAPVGAWILFAILFLWQIPHTLAIACLYREDYTRAGILVLPAVDPDGASTRRLILVSCLALLSVPLLPTLVGMSGRIYFLAALMLGIGLLVYGIRLGSPSSVQAHRKLLLATLAYLPILFVVMLLDAPAVFLW